MVGAGLNPLIRRLLPLSDVDVAEKMTGVSVGGMMVAAAGVVGRAGVPAFDGNVCSGGELRIPVPGKPCLGIKYKIDI